MLADERSQGNIESETMEELRGDSGNYGNRESLLRVASEWKTPGRTNGPQLDWELSEVKRRSF